GDFGVWAGSREIEFYDYWQRCDLDGTNCDGTGDYDPHYTITEADRGKALRYGVTATNDGGRALAYSALHVVDTAPAPENTSPPAVSGKARLGVRLTANPGGWTNDPTFAYQWQRCDAADWCTDVATGAAYTTTAADVDKRLRVKVTASNAGG